MEKPDLRCISCFIIHFFSRALAGNQTNAFQQFQMMGNCRAAHIHQRRYLHNTFFIVAQQKKNPKPVAVGKLFEIICDIYKIERILYDWNKWRVLIK